LQLFAIFLIMCSVFFFSTENLKGLKRNTCGYVASLSLALARGSQGGGLQPIANYRIKHVPTKAQLFYGSAASLPLALARGSQGGAPTNHELPNQACADRNPIILYK
jgi:hypothetical protein